MDIVRKNTCGQLFPTDQIFFTGDFPDFITGEERNLNTVLKEFGEILDQRLLENVLSELDPLCLDFDPKTDTLAILLQEEVNKTCNHTGRIFGLEETPAIDIGESTIDVDLQCLTPEVDECDIPPHIYTLVEIFEIFVAELCVLGPQIEELCNPASGTSGTSGVAVGNNGTSGTSGTSGFGIV